MSRVEWIACGLALLASLGGGCAGNQAPSPPPGASEGAPASASAPGAPPETPSATGSAPSGASADIKPPQDLDACILEVLRDPFPGQNLPAGRYYGEAVEAFAQGGYDHAGKLFSETYLFDGSVTHIPLGHFGHGEIERRGRDPINRHLVIGRYDRILGLKTPHPVRELTLLRKSQGLAAIGKPEAALATLAELDARTTLGRCDAGIRSAMTALLTEIVGNSSKFDAKACADAWTVVERLGAESARKAVASRCPP